MLMLLDAETAHINLMRTQNSLHEARSIFRIKIETHLSFDVYLEEENISF